MFFFSELFHPHYSWTWWQHGPFLGLQYPDILWVYRVYTLAVCGQKENWTKGNRYWVKGKQLFVSCGIFDAELKFIVVGVVFEKTLAKIHHHRNCFPVVHLHDSQTSKTVWVETITTIFGCLTCTHAVHIIALWSSSCILNKLLNVFSGTERQLKTFWR